MRFCVPVALDGERSKVSAVGTAQIGAEPALAWPCNGAGHRLVYGHLSNGEALNMKLNLAAFTLSVSLREVLSYVRIRFSIRSDLVHA